MLRTRFSEALKDGLKSKNERMVATVRLIMAGLKDKDIAARPKGVTAIPDEEILQMMTGMIKQRRESIDMFEKGNRPELAKQEQDEIDIIQSFMPKQMDEAEQTAAIKSAIADSGAASIKDMGKVMAVLRAKYAATLDMAKAGPIVKAMLSA